MGQKNSKARKLEVVSIPVGKKTFMFFDFMGGRAAFDFKEAKNPVTVFDFKGADLCLNEAGRGWVVLKYVPFEPCESKCKGAL